MKNCVASIQDTPFLVATVVCAFLEPSSGVFSPPTCRAHSSAAALPEAATRPGNGPPHDAHCRSAVVLAGSLVPIVRCAALLAPEAISGRGGDEGPGGAGPGGWAHAWRVCYVSRRWAFWSRRERRRGGRRGGGEDKRDGGGQEEEKANALADGVAGCRARG